MKLTRPTLKALMKDEELIDMYLNTQRGDYFEHLYNRYVGKVYQRCLSLTKDAVQAQDFTQDIFVRVLTKLDRFQERSSFSTWLYAISYNYCMDQLRAGKRLTFVTMDENAVLHEDEIEGNIAVEQQLQQLAHVVTTLRTGELTLLHLRYEQGLPVEDIAHHLQLKESAVKMRLKRTRDKLRILYAQTYPEV